MSQVVVRPLEERYAEAFFAVASMTYGDGLPVAEDRREARFGTQRYVGLVGDEVAGICAVLPLTATRGAALLPCGGVASVAVAPERRRGGVGNSMMDDLVREMRNHGLPLASLYAYREPFYAKSGYAVVGKRLRITVPTHRIPKVGSDLEIRRLTPDDWREIAPCYAAFAHARSGANVRSETMWGRVLNENRPLAIYAAGDPVEGYVAISHKIDFWVEQWFSEVAWSTPRGYRACIDLMRQLGINKSSVAWYEPSDSPFYAQYLDQGVEVKVERPVMFRVNDVPAALRLLKPTAEGETRLRIFDNVVPENEGPWRIAFSSEGVSVERCDGHDVAMDVRHFAQACMGEPSLADLVRHGTVDGDTTVLERLLPPSPTLCGDFF